MRMAEQKPDIWLPIYCGDYLKDTMRLTLAEHGAYFMLMMAYWQDGCLKHSLEDCFRICKAFTQAEQDAVRRVVESFFTVSDGMLRNKRLDQELEAARERQDKAQARARKGAEARWAKRQAEPEGYADDASSNAKGNASSIQQAQLEKCPSPSPSSTPTTSKSKAPEPGGSVAAKAASPDVQAVFEHWQAVMGHARAALDDKRRALIVRALKHYSADDLRRAIDGCKASPFHMGDNDRGTVYDGLSLILRNAENIDKFVRMSGAQKPNLPRAKSRQEAVQRGNADAVAEWLASQGVPSSDDGDVIEGECYATE